jgi:hypothetical protein
VNANSSSRRVDEFVLMRMYAWSGQIGSDERVEVRVGRYLPFRHQLKMLKKYHNKDMIKRGLVIQRSDRVILGLGSD